MENIKGDVLFSPCKKHRLYLTRIWEPTGSIVMFIGLNPSVANKEKNDPTMRRVIDYAKQWGFGGVVMVNCYSYIATKPKDLVTENIPDTDFYIWKMGQNSAQVVFAWGAHKEAQVRAKYFEQCFPDAVCLTKNSDGSPKHPLYCRKDLTPTPWKNS